jgi:hypothetical protein
MTIMPPPSQIVKFLQIQLHTDNNQILAPAVRVFAMTFFHSGFVRGALAGGPAPFVVNLGGRHMPVAQQLFHFHNVHAGIEQERGGGGAQRGRRSHTEEQLRSEQRSLLNPAR